MAGSIKWMIYTADDGKKYATKLDESNGEAFGFDDVGGASSYDAVIPRSFKMRTVNLISADGKTRRSVPVGSITNEYWTGESGVAVIGGINYQVTSTSGERAVRPFALDTGLDDGDAS